LAIKYVRSFSFHLQSAEPDRTKLDSAETNQGLHHQIVLWDLHSSGILCSIGW